MCIDRISLDSRQKVQMHSTKSEIRNPKSETEIRKSGNPEIRKSEIEIRGGGDYINEKSTSIRIAIASDIFEIFLPSSYLYLHIDLTEIIYLVSGYFIH